MGGVELRERQHLLRQRLPDRIVVRPVDPDRERVLTQPELRRELIPVRRRLEHIELDPVRHVRGAEARRLEPGLPEPRHRHQLRPRRIHHIRIRRPTSAGNHDGSQCATGISRSRFASSTHTSPRVITRSG